MSLEALKDVTVSDVVVEKPEPQRILGPLLRNRATKRRRCARMGRLGISKFTINGRPLRHTSPVLFYV